MKRTIRLRESELKHMISESVKRIISEGVRRYKGFKYINVSDDPSFPSYAIISPEGKTIDKTLFPSEMKEIVDNYLKKGNFKEYDPNWETSDSPEEFSANKSDLRKFNKKIGRDSSVGMDYLSEGKLNSIVSNSLREVLKEIKTNV